MRTEEEEQRIKLINKTREDYRKRLHDLVENIQAELDPSHIHTKEELVIKLERILIRVKMFR